FGARFLSHGAGTIRVGLPPPGLRGRQPAQGEPGDEEGDHEEDAGRGQKEGNETASAGKHSTLLLDAEAVTAFLPSEFQELCICPLRPDLRISFARGSSGPNVILIIPRKCEGSVEKVEKMGPDVTAKAVSGRKAFSRLRGRRRAPGERRSDPRP